MFNKKIYVVESSATHNGKKQGETFTDHFANKGRAMAFCEQFMAICKAECPDGTASNPSEGVYRFTFTNGAIEEYKCYSAPLH